VGEKPGVVYDTNVLISALGWSGNPEQCLELVFTNQVTGYISPVILNEVWATMEYPRLGFTAEEKRSFLGIITTVFNVVEPRITVSKTRDPDDDKFLELAEASEADYIVSGDDDLLDLNQFHEVKIMAPAEFLDHLGE